MVAKPDVDAVRLVITTKISDSAVSALIDDAALIAAGCPVVDTYSTDLQTAIVKYLAAHLIASRSDGPGVLVSKKIGDASESYGRATMGMQLQSTTYGQQAIALDPTGCLKRLGNVRVIFKAM